MPNCKMAGRSQNANANHANANVVRQLLSRLDELSSEISSQNVENAGVESEVRNVFNGNRRPVSSNNTNYIHRSSACAPRVQTGQPIGGQTLQRSAPNRLVFMARRNFSGQRPSNSSRKPKKPNAIDSRPFMRDLILLAGPETNVIPRQGTRLALMENGHVITGCKFTKGMNAAQVLITIVEAFDGKIPQGVDIEIMMSMHTKLVAPTLAPGQLGIDGAILQRLFQTKPIYVRPSKQILATTDLVGEEVRFYKA